MKHTTSGQVITDRPLNNAQRKALADIVEKRLGTKATAAREAERELEQKLTREIATRFQVDSIQAEIDKHEAQIENLKQARRSLGFKVGYDEQLEIVDGKVRRLLESGVQANSLTIRALEDKQDELQQGIWLAQTVEEAKAVVQQIEQL